MKVFGVILAGGASRRMAGQPKQGLTLNGKTLLTMVEDKARLQVDRLFISGNATKLHEYTSNIAFIEDNKPHEGPLYAQATSLCWIHRQFGASTVFFFPCDTPIFPEKLCKNLLIAKQTNKPIYASYSGHNHYTFAAWDSFLGERLVGFCEHGSRSLRSALLHFHGTRYEFKDQGDPGVFYNINTPADWEQFISMQEI